MPATWPSPRACNTSSGASTSTRATAPRTDAEAEYAWPSAERFGLTATELAVLVLLADGHTTYGISRRLGMAPRTASKHLEHIYRKLDVTHRIAAVNVARTAGLNVGINDQGSVVR